MIEKKIAAVDFQPCCHRCEALHEYRVSTEAALRGPGVQTTKGCTPPPCTYYCYYYYYYYY